MTKEQIYLENWDNLFKVMQDDYRKPPKNMQIFTFGNHSVAISDNCTRGVFKDTLIMKLKVGKQ